MRINNKKVREIMEESQITKEKLSYATGLTEKTVSRILENGFVSVDAMERIADAISANIRDITLPEITGGKENIIEFLKDENTATVTFSQGRYITKIKKLAAEHPDECQIIAENNDGSICARIPVKLVRIGSYKNFSDEQREILSVRMKRIRSAQ